MKKYRNGTLLRTTSDPQKQVQSTEGLIGQWADTPALGILDINMTADHAMLSWSPETSWAQWLCHGGLVTVERTGRTAEGFRQSSGWAVWGERALRRQGGTGRRGVWANARFCKLMEKSSNGQRSPQQVPNKQGPSCEPLRPWLSHLPQKPFLISPQTALKSLPGSPFLKAVSSLGLWMCGWGDGDGTGPIATGVWETWREPGVGSSSHGIESQARLGPAVQSSSNETQPARSLGRKENCGYPSHGPADVFTKVKNKSSDCSFRTFEYSDRRRCCY